MRLSILTLVVGLGVGLKSFAHMPFIAPVSFEPAHENWVSLDAGFAESLFYSDVAFDKSAIGLVDPNGHWSKPSQAVLLKTRTVIEHQLTEEGTYRFSTGLRYGAVFRFYEINGERKATRDPQEVLPEGAKLLDHYQSVTLAETYVTRKNPTEAVLKSFGKGLELIPVKHPNDLYSGESFRLQLLFDGKPVSKKEINLFAAEDGNQGEKSMATQLTDAQGFVEFLMKNPGVFMLHVRHIAAAPKNAEAPNYGFIYTLSFQVEPAL